MVAENGMGPGQTSKFILNEQRHEKTCFLNMCKQWRKSAPKISVHRYTCSNVPLLSKSEISSVFCGCTAGVLSDN